MLQIFSRSKNTVNILIKNWLDMCIGAVVYWAFGFGLTFGTDQGRFIGTTYFFFHEMAGKVWIKGGLISKIIQEITVPQIFYQNLKFEGQWFCTFFEEPPFNLFMTSESPKIRIPIVQILCFDLFNDSATNNLR